MTKLSVGTRNFACYLDLEVQQAKASLRAKERKERKAKVARQHSATVAPVFLPFWLRQEPPRESTPTGFFSAFSEFFSIRSHPPINPIQEKARRGRIRAKAKTKGRRKAPGVAWKATSQKRRSQGGNPTAAAAKKRHKIWATKMAQIYC